MKQSDEIKDLALALCKAQSMMPKATMSGVNARFKNEKAKITGAYANLDDILTAAKPALNKCEIAFTQHAYAIGGEVGVETMLMHSSGQYIVSRFGVPADAHGAQAYGSIVTYCRRFGLASMVGLTAEEDADGENIPESASSPSISAQQVGQIQNILAEKHINEADLLKHKKVENLTQIKASDFDALLSQLKAKP